MRFLTRVSVSCNSCEESVFFYKHILVRIYKRMKTILYFNDCICSSLEQLRKIVSKKLIPNTPIYEDLLTLQRDGELAQWLAEGNTEDEISISTALTELSPELPNNELIQAIIGVLLDDMTGVSKPIYSLFFEINAIRCKTNDIPIDIEEEDHNNISWKINMSSCPISAVTNKHWAELTLDIELKIKKVDNELFIMKLSEENDSGYGIMIENDISLKDKYVGQIVTITMGPFIVGERNENMQLMIDNKVVRAITFLKY